MSEQPQQPPENTSAAEPAPVAKPARRGLHWRWVLVGVAVMVAGHVAAYLLLRSRIVSAVERDPVMAFATAGGIALTIFFAGGLVVGRLSPGRTIQEPAVAAVLGLLSIVGLQLLVGMINIFGLFLGTPFAFAMAYLGGWAGEKWQTAAERAAERRRS